MDEARLEQLDAAPLKPDLDRVAAITTKAAFTRDMARQPVRFRRHLVRARHFWPIRPIPAMNTLVRGQGGMGLPDRDYYLLDKYKPQRDAYRAYIERTLGMIGHADAAAEADRIWRSRPSSPRLRWPHRRPARLQQAQQPDDPGELAAYAPGIDWGDYLATAKRPRRS